DPVAFLIRRGEDHDRYEFRSLVCSNPPQHVEPVDLRELQVEEYHRRQLGIDPPGVAALREQVVESFLPVVCDHDLVPNAVLAQRSDLQLFVALRVLDQQDELLAHGRASSRVKRKMAPRPSAPSAEARPPCRSTMRCTVARPMPVPLSRTKNTGGSSPSSAPSSISA